jgi:hypothetical protein
MKQPSLPVLALLASCSLLSLELGTTRLVAEDAVQFNRDIRPILSDNCFQCHGPDPGQRQVSLRLDTETGLRDELESGGRAVVAGKPQESELIRRIMADDPDVRMPPADSGKQLSEAQRELLRRWVEQGGEWQGHWAFIPPVRPELPATAYADRVSNALDNFILARLEARGLRPSPAADKTTLIRRLSFDLTGLPPTPEEVDAFLADDSPMAYERLVDRLLQSERFGEHLARVWLDLARYGDTHGLHFDNERALWKYREWVIGALNRNLPFDRFVMEQLAGDLLPDATIEQQIATGFNRCNVSTSEGGSINEEVLVRYAVDRTSTMGTVFMGLTLGCAVCHDHKFDPISQKELYQLLAYFNASADAAMDGNQLAPAPIVKVPRAEDTARLEQLSSSLAAARENIRNALSRVEYVDPHPDAAAKPLESYEYVWIEDAAPAEAQLQGDSAWEFVTRPDHPVFSGEKATRREAGGLSQHFFTGAKPGLQIGEGDKLFAYVYLDPQNPPKTVMLQFHDGSWEHRAYWGEDAIPFGAGGQENHLAMGPLPALGEWTRLEVDASAVGLKAGAVLNGWAFTQFGGLVYWDKAGSVTRTPQEGRSFDSLAEWEAFERGLEKSQLPQDLRSAVTTAPAQRSEEQSRKIREYFLEHICSTTRAVFGPLHNEVSTLEKQRQDVENSIPVSMIMADLPQPRDTFVLVRGQYDKPGEKVSPGVPAIFPPLPDEAPANRLGLARWLVRPDHPLTARVAVNRIWQHYFGQGLVQTAEDFGVQGQQPTHPELLDWLAVDFVENGWDVKRLHKQIVMSATYRQSSQLTPELLQKDPDNELLARGPRYRLDAEVVRDGALYVSGLLVEQVGGPSVKPYQPDGIWEAVGFVGSNTREYRRDSGPALYRRSLYTFWKRTAPPPALMAFDAPSREACVARRGRTNTPLQALVLMNDEQYVEASRHLSRRMLQAGRSTAEQLSHGFRLATARRPSDAELAVLLDTYNAHHAHFTAHHEAAERLMQVGESKRDDSLDLIQHASMTMVANLILNLDETISKE